MSSFLNILHCQVLIVLHSDGHKFDNRSEPPKKRISSTSQELLMSVGIELETHLNKYQRVAGDQPWLKKNLNKGKKITSSATTSAY